MCIDITNSLATDEWEKLMVCDIPLENEFFTLSGKRVSETFNFTQVKKKCNPDMATVPWPGKHLEHVSTFRL